MSVFGVLFKDNRKLIHLKPSKKLSRTQDWWGGGAIIWL